MRPYPHKKPLFDVPVSGAAKKERLHASLLLLAGGEGSRMGGRNKLYLEFEGSLIIEGTLELIAPLFEETVLVVAPEESLVVKDVLCSSIRKWSIVLVEDRIKGRGPLEGLYNGLRHMKEDWGFLLGCDMPTPDPGVIRCMAGFCADNDAVVAKRLGHLEPLHAFYRKTCVGPVFNAIRRGDRKIRQFYDSVELTVVDEAVLKKSGDVDSSFFNLNTPHDVKKMKLNQEVKSE